jgi:WD40-like Beta Propeller Repeat
VTQQPPGTTPVLFASGIVSVYGSDENTLTITPDGHEIYFGKEAAIWVCRLTGAGWTAPRRTAIPGYEMWISPHTGTMYYTGYDPGMWAMERTAQGWGTPVRLVAKGMFSTLTSDETLYTTVFDERGKANVGRYVKQDGQYTTAETFGPEVNGPTSFDAHPNVAPDGRLLVFDSDRAEGNGLYLTRRRVDGSWGPARYLGQALAGGSLSTFSPDGRYLFFVKHRDIYWVSAAVLDDANRSRPRIPRTTRNALLRAGHRRDE